MRALIVIILSASAIFAFAATSDINSVVEPLDINGHRAQTVFDSLPTLVEVLERGFPVALSQEAGDADTVWERGAGDFDSTIKSGDANLQKIRGAFLKSIRGTTKMRAARMAEAPSSKPFTTQKPTPEKALVPTAEKVPGFSEKNWKLFCRCAPGALEALKSKQRAIAMGQEFAAYEIESQLGKTRGDGDIISSEGLSCGRYLGAYGTKVSSLDEDVAALATLSLPEAAGDFSRTWHYYILFQNPSADQVKVSDFWKFAWKKVTFGKLVARKSAPEPKEWVKAYVDYRSTEFNDDKKKVSLKLDEKALEDAVIGDWKNLTPLAKVVPCE
jgi:hypothetical protein